MATATKTRSKDKEALLNLLAIHYARGALKEQDAPVGRHEVGGKRVIIDIPEGAVLERLEGSLKDGYEEYAKGLNLLTVLLFLERGGGLLTGAKARRLWVECFRRSLENDKFADKLKDKPDRHLPAEALEALVELKAELADKKKTLATRVGIALATVTVEG